jgi:hypothetical protein
MIGFASSAYLWALAAIAVPVAIHLLMRDRIQRVDFPTLRFFAKGAKMVLRKRRVDEALLLALRVLLVALIVLAFARPGWGQPADEAGTAERARVLVLDGSGSMGPYRDWLAATAKRRLGELTPGRDVVAVVGIGSTVRALAEPSTDYAKAQTALDTFAPGNAGTDLVSALRKADELLATVKARDKSIVLISDLQRCGWATFRGDWKLAAGVALAIDQPEALAAVGVVITDADAPGNIALDGVPRAISLRLANQGADAAAGVKVALLIDGAETDTRSIDLPAKGVGTVRFRRTFDTSGEHTCEIVAGSGDAAYHHRFVVRVMERVPVALITDGPLRSGNDPAFFAKLALAPDEQSPFVVQEVTANGDPAKLANVRVAIVADAGEPPAAMHQALAGVLARGGGLLFMPGVRSEPETFRRAFADLAPCRPLRILSEDPEMPQAIASIDFAHAAFEIFARPHWGDLAVPRFTRYWEVADVQGAAVSLRLANGRPLLVERRIGEGISMLLASAPDPAWNDLPFQAVFLPVLHQTIRHLAVRGLPPTVLAVGERLPGVPTSAVQRPDGSKAVLAETTTDLPGFYVCTQPGEPSVSVAVNRPFAESDPAVIPADQLAAAIQRGGSGAETSGQAVRSGGPASSWWWWVLAAAACLAVAELTIGNRAQRH